MTAIALRNFRGVAPRTSDRSLAATQATRARNCRLTSGRIDPLKGLMVEYDSRRAPLQTIYRYRFEGDDNWLTWQTRVHVVASPVPQDAFGRLYISGNGEPQMTTYAAAIDGSGVYPAAAFVLGPVAPITAPTVSSTGGVSATVEDRTYLYTFRTALGEESGPSPASAVLNGKIDDTWTVAGLDVAPPNGGTVTSVARNTPTVGMCRVSLNTVVGLAAGETILFTGVLGMTDLNQGFTISAVGSGTVDVVLSTSQVYTGGGVWQRVLPHNTVGMTKRIYRTAGTGEYRRVAEVDVSVTSYADTVLGVALGDSITTLLSLPPPKNLRSLVVLANGALAGISGNEVCFSEIAKPHSWPIGNRYSFAGEGVALVAVNNSVVLLTDSNPIIVTATSPEAASLSRSPLYAPCYSEPGTVDAGEGAIFPSYDGLYLVGPGSARNLTEGLYRKTEWEKLLPRTFVAAFWDQTYHAGHASLVAPLSQIFTLDLIDPIGVVEVDERAEVFYSNPIDGKLYLTQGGTIYEWDADPYNPYTAFWRSREYQLGSDTNFACYRIHADFPTVTGTDVAQLAANAALMANADNVDGEVAAAEVNTYDINGSAIVPVSVAAPSRVDFSVLIKGAAVHTTQVVDNEMDRLPAGFLANVYAFEVSTTVSIYSIVVANDVDELTADFS